LENNLLCISSEMKNEDEKTDGKYSRKEFSYQSFSRSFSLPDLVDEEHIKAKYENGILFVNIPKKEEAKPKPPKAIKIS
ncbi:MAG: Hsp20/alpha crystallin family protein, partial [Bacteroidales bacterium]|nr:Hsp20/alpha crystallin family protein [Bacteroidales bacterium]